MSESAGPGSLLATSMRRRNELDPRFLALGDAEKKTVSGFYDQGLMADQAFMRLDEERRATEKKNQKSLEDVEQQKMRNLDMMRGTRRPGGAPSAPTVLGGRFSIPKTGKRLLGY